MFRTSGQTNKAKTTTKNNCEKKKKESKGGAFIKPAGCSFLCDMTRWNFPQKPHGTLGTQV